MAKAKRNAPPAGEKLWGGRFTEPTDVFVERFTASVGFDCRMYRQDIRGSIAHARMLHTRGILTRAELRAIETGLRRIESEIASGHFTWQTALEDVHMNIEARLTARIGQAGKKLHTGRSRNDQVATDLRLYLRDGVDELLDGLHAVEAALITLARREAPTLMPGFTHLQIAQPVSFGHHMLAWVEMLARDADRLLDCRRRMNVSPLGSAALAGTPYRIDRALTARLLGFDAPTANSLDAVSDRDFAVEFTFCCAVLGMHLSRMSEELVMWASPMFAFIDLPDAYCTGSSIMPQKKNPDVPELVRGKTGRVYGHLMGLLTLMKSQPLAYNKDNQEDKEPVFDALDTARDCLQAFAGMVPRLSVNRARMRAVAAAGFSTATDLADYLVRKAIPFRDAHEQVGLAVRYCIESGKGLEGLSLSELRRFAPRAGRDVFKVLSVEGSASARNHIGATAPVQVRKAVQVATRRLSARRSLARRLRAKSRMPMSKLR